MSIETYETPDADTIVVERRRGRGLAVALGLLTAVGITGASAAWIGGIKDQGIGGDTTAVTSCDTDGIVTKWVPEWSATIDQYAARVLIVSEIDKACDGWTMRVMVQNSKDDKLGEFEVAITPTEMKVDLGDTIPASEVSEIDVTFFRV